MAMDGAPAMFCTSTEACALPAVAVMVVVAFGVSATFAATNVPVVSPSGLAIAVYVAPAAVTTMCAGSASTYVPVTSMAVAPVCAEGSGDVMLICGVAPGTVTMAV